MMSEDHICAEIMYKNEEGQGVHSDLCGSLEQWSDKEYREFLHKSLDEFLDAKDMTGLFYVGDVVPHVVDD